MYTSCYQGLMMMSEEEDLEEFRNSLRPHSMTNRLEMQRSVSKQSLNSTMNTMNTTQMSNSSAPTTPNTIRRNVDSRNESRFTERNESRLTESRMTDSRLDGTATSMSRYDTQTPMSDTLNTTNQSTTYYSSTGQRKPNKRRY